MKTVPKVMASLNELLKTGFLECLHYWYALFNLAVLLWTVGPPTPTHALFIETKLNCMQIKARQNSFSIMHHYGRYGIAKLHNSTLLESFFLIHFLLQHLKLAFYHHLSESPLVTKLYQLLKNQMRDLTMWQVRSLTKIFANDYNKRTKMQV